MPQLRRHPQLLLRLPRPAISGEVSGEHFVGFGVPGVDAQGFVAPVLEGADFIDAQVELGEELGDLRVVGTFFDGAFQEEDGVAEIPECYLLQGLLVVVLTFRHVA